MGNTKQPIMQRRTVMKALGAATGLGIAGTGTTAAYNRSENDRTHNHPLKPDTQLIGTWSGSPVPPAQSGLSQTGVTNQTLREIVHTSIGGSGVRLRLTNTYGNQSVSFGEVTVGIRDSGASVVPNTNKTVTFGGEKSVLIPAGAIAYSDPVQLDVDPLEDLAVSLYSATASGPATWHPLALHKTYISENGNHTEDIGSKHFTNSTEAWFFLDGVDVITQENMGTIVALGDSITDGYQSTPGADHTWPDYFARRLINHKSVHKSIVNAGISGNRVLHDSLSGASFGNNALARLNRDVIAQPGVTDVILLEGINDIGQYPPAVTAEQIIGGLKQIAMRVHAHNVNIFAGTLTPTRGTIYGTRYDSPEGEAKREMVNHFIRTTDLFDGVIDFDAAIRDPNQPDQMLPRYDSGDHLHPNDAGYQAMADAIDLSLFKGKRYMRRSLA